MTEINIFFQNLFDVLNTRDHHVFIMAVYLCCFVLTVLLRVITCMHFRSLLLRFKMDALTIKSVEDIKRIRFGLLKRLAAEYQYLAARNASRIPTEALVEQQLAGMGLPGWRYNDIMPLVELMENGLLWVGLIIATVFNQYAVVYGVLAVGIFLFTRLSAAFFNFRSARSQAANRFLIYLESEIGSLFPVNINGIIKPKMDLSDAAEKVYAILQKPLAEWAETLSEAGRIQKQINESAQKMQEAAVALAKPIQEHSAVLKGLAASQDSISAQMKLVEQNQHALETAYQSYEASLKSLVQTLGDGLGAYLKLHGQSAAQAVNDTLAGNIEKMMNTARRQGGSNNG